MAIRSIYLIPRYHYLIPRYHCLIPSAARDLT